MPHCMMGILELEPDPFSAATTELFTYQSRLFLEFERFFAQELQIPEMGSPDFYSEIKDFTPHNLLSSLCNVIVSSVDCMYM